MAQINHLAPFILRWEGGFVNDPTDRGGATNMGVTLSTWRQVGYDKDGDGDIDVDDLKLLTKQEVVDRVLKPHYWDRWKADRIQSQSVANILVDWVWCSGAHGIIRVQRLLGVKADGVVGNITLSALNARSPLPLWTEIKADREKFLHQLVHNSVVAYEKKIGRTATESEQLKYTQKRFLKGWINRLNDLHYKE